jgi:hypothetical protein
MKVTFDFAAQKISVEGDAPQLLEVVAAVRELAPSLKEIVINPNGARSAASDHPPTKPQFTGSGGQNGGPLSGQTIRQFVKSLGVSTASERIAAIAYYVKHQDGKDVFSPKEMDGWFGICGLQKPAQMPVAVSDAKRHTGYVDNAGHGKWRITNNGENLVVGKLNSVEDGAG